MQAITFKIIVLGAQGVGKSSLIMRYIKGDFAECYNVTFGVEFFTKIVKVEPQSFVRLQIWDTAGQQFFRAIVRSFYKGIVAVFFVFAVDKQASLKQLQSWAEEVRQNAHEEVVFFLIGSRADMQGKREVSTDQADEFMKRMEGVYFVETSAKTGQNIDILFQKAAEILFQKYKTNPEFAKLVQLDNQAVKGQDEESGQTIVMKKDVIPISNKKSGKQNHGCCV